MSVTIRDVARAAGVSVATVSRAFNDSGPVHAETRQRIREVALAMRYVPNSAARTLTTAKANACGVLLPDLYGEFFSEVIRGIDQTARRHGHHLLISSSHDDQAEMEAAVRAMRGRVDGFILMLPDVDIQAVAANLPENLPVVMVNCADTDGLFDTVSIDNYGGAYAMVRHLLAQGRERVAIITGGSRNQDARERLRGYSAALWDAGAEWRAEWEIAGDFTEEGGYKAAQRIAQLDPRPDAVFAANDAMAIGALSAFREGGLLVPLDMALGGFDDVPTSRYMSPPLTSVHVDISELGAQAMATLLASTNGGSEKNGHEPRRIVLPATLKIRHSCGSAR
jgi:LacI family transcriptional regulator